jgi:tetratricopeptide (TPR) repeat protein
MTKAVLEAESQGAVEHLTATVPSSALAVPASLQASLMARLDRLGPAKEVAQIGAAIGREFSHALIAAVVHEPEAELGSALDRLVAAGLLFRQGVPPHATYPFKHALVQDAAYGTLLREHRRSLHARIAEALESQFTDITESQPELLARHCTEAGLIEKAASLWGKGGRRSFERSALVEAIAQLTRALDQIATLSATPALRREALTLQVALITPLLHVKGFAAPETKAAVEQARLLINQAEALGEQPEDPLLLFLVLYGVWIAHFAGFQADVVHEIAVQFLKLAEKQGATVPIMIGHRLVGASLLYTGDISQGRVHLGRSVALYDPQHRSLTSRFGADVKVTALGFRSFALWLLGYPEAALEDLEQAFNHTRAIGEAVTLTNALICSVSVHFLSGNFAAAGTHADELTALAEEKGTLYWKAWGMAWQGCLMAVTGNL